MAKKGEYINIKFPFQESKNGFFIELNENDSDAIKSDLLHLILTRRGERLYKPDFGTNLLQFIFEPNDSITLNEIKSEINTTVKKYIPNLRVTEVTVEPIENSEYRALVTINYTITEDVFNESDVIVIQI